MAPITVTYNAVLFIRHDLSNSPKHISQLAPKKGSRLRHLRMCLLWPRGRSTED